MCVYGNINDSADPTERRKAAAQLIQEIKGRKNKVSLLQSVLINYRYKWRAKTFSCYQTVVKYFDVFCRDQIITPNLVTSFINHLRIQGKSTKTIAKYRNTLFSLFELAMEMGLTEINPIKKVNRIKYSSQSLMYFSDQQIDKFKECNTNNQLWLSIQLLFYCFIRPGEQRHAKINWINFDYGFIEIPGAFSKNGKTQKVSIPTKFLTQINWLKEYPGEYYILSKKGIPGKIQIATKYLNEENKKVLQKAGTRGHYAFYSWKHTGVVKAVRAGINLKDLQLQLRHHSLDMVNEYLKDLGVMDSQYLKDNFPTL